MIGLNQRIEISLIALGLIFLPATRTQAALITVAGDTGDGGVEVNGIPVNLSDPDFRPGTGGNIIRGQAAIYFFALPKVPSPSAITSVELQFQYLGIYVDSVPSIPEFNLDLFGINGRPDALIEASDYYDGIAALSTDSLIAESVITPTTVAGNISVAHADLLDFVRSLYDASGLPLAEFAAFRINPDKDLPNNSGLRRGYLVAMADNPTERYRPTLVITAVPEPSSLLLWLIGGTFLCRIRFK